LCIILAGAKKRKNDVTDCEEDDDDEVDEEDDEDDENDADAANQDKRGVKRQKISWNKHEIVKFLNILIEKHVVAKLDGKCGRLRHSVVFKTVAKALNEVGSGTTKTYQHCKGKYRKLKEKFQELEKHNNRSGSDRKTCENYDLLATLFSKRPRMTASDWAYDSGSQDVPGAAGTTRDLCWVHLELQILTVTPLPS